MAQFHWSMKIIGRSKGRSVVAAAAYRAGERLHDERSGLTHDFRNRRGVEHKEILIPDDAPIWVRGIDREALWNRVEAGEKRKDAQTARELEFMLPREIPPEQRIALARDYMREAFVAKGAIVDLAWHNKLASDGLEHPHCHALITMRPLTEVGFGPKARHDMVPDPEGRTHPDGRPVLVESNPDSWNSAIYFERTREQWETIANKALEDAGSDARIDRRSLLARGLARLPEPALRLAHYLDDLWGVMKDRFGQFLVARHHREVEERAKEAFAWAELPAVSPADAASTHERFFGWFERQLARLEPAPKPGPEPPRFHEPEPER